MKKIAVDLRCLESPTGKRGIGYFTRSLFEHLLLHYHPDFSFNLVTFPASKLSKMLTIEPKDKFVTIPAAYWPKKGLRRLDPFFAIFWSRFLKRNKPDLLHITSLFEVYYLDIPDNIPTIVTLYDIIPLLFPKYYFQNEKAKNWYLKRLESVKHASKIITISNSSKKDLVKLLNIPPQKIEVIYGGVDEKFKLLGKEQIDPVLKKYGIKGKYVLTVSTHSFHKNTEKMFKIIKNLDLNLVVVCSLKGFEERDWRNQIKKNGVEGKVILTNFVNDEDLPAIFNGAEIFLFPSLYEGLGLPVLEAFACGIPVITSSTSSLPEVGGDAVLYVDHQDEEDITKSIKQLLSDRKLRKDLIRKGFVQVKKFSWEKAARQTLKVYEEVLSSK